VTIAGLARDICVTHAIWRRDARVTIACPRYPLSFSGRIRMVARLAELTLVPRRDYENSILVFGNETQGHHLGNSWGHALQRHLG
jgi:hypothetical protein